MQPEAVWERGTKIHIQSSNGGRSKDGESCMSVIVCAVDLLLLLLLLLLLFGWSVEDYEIGR
jgi:hypothetical protein